MSALAEAAADYLRVRRALGYKLGRQGRQLLQFVAYLDQAGTITVTIEHAIAWATKPAGGDCNYWCDRLSVVRQFARYLHTIDPSCEVPPKRLLPYRRRRPTPYLYAPQRISALMAAAGELRGALHPSTMQTLIGLMAVTGMRIGETIRLDRDDVDHRHQLLRIIDSKFGKSRELALHETTIHALDQAPSGATGSARGRAARRSSSPATAPACSPRSCTAFSLASSRASASNHAPGAAAHALTTSGTASLAARSLTGTPPTPTCRPGCPLSPHTWACGADQHLLLPDRRPRAARARGQTPRTRPERTLSWRP